MVAVLNFQYKNLDKTQLWKARDSAMSSVYKPWFPKLEAAYLEGIKSTFKGKCLRFYSDIYNTADYLGQQAIKIQKAFIQTIRLGLLYIPGYQRFEDGLNKVHNFFFPVNPVNGQRTFNFCPRIIEKFLGDVLIAPSYLSDQQKTNAVIQGPVGAPARYIDHINQDVLDRLLNAPKNKEVLNPEFFAKFNYRVFSSKDSVVNAFALPAGLMVVTSQIVQELNREIMRTHNAGSLSGIKNTTITKADGSKVTVDLTNVQLEDVLAALIGHEMTHIASRHYTVGTTVAYIGRFIFKCLTAISFAFIRSKDAKNQENFKSKNIDVKKPVAASEKKYAQAENLIQQAGDWFFSFARLFNSRKNEHEADITGTYFAINAGYNPLGALYLQEFLSRQSSGFLESFFPNWGDFISTHPAVEKRKTAVYTALKTLDPII